MCAQLPLDSQVWPSLAIAELSTTEAFAACMSCLLCRGLFSCAATVLERDQDAWVQRRCPARCMLFAQLPLDSQVWPSNCRIKHDQGIAASTSFLRSHGLFSYVALVLVRKCNAHVLQRC